MKVVDYGGLELCIPDWAEYLALDESGEVWCSKSKPVYIKYHGYWLNIHNDGICFLQAGVTLNCSVDQSLLKVEKILNEYF